MFQGGSSHWKFSKKSKIFQNSKNAQNRSQKCPNVFWRCFRVIFSKFFFAQCSMEGRVFEFFQKNQKSFKFPKCPKSSPKVSKRKFSKSKKISNFQKSRKSFPKVSKRVLNKFRVNLSEKKLLPSVRWRVESSKFFKKIKKYSKFQKCPNSIPKCPNVFWKCFRVFFRKNFSPMFHGGSSLRKFSKRSKKFQRSKNAQNRPQKCPNKNFKKKIKKSFKNPKMPKIVPKSVQTKIFKIKKKSKFQKSPKSFQKVSQRVLNKFSGDFFEKNFCPVFHGGSSLRKFSKKSKKFQSSKNAQNRPQKCPNENFQNQKKFQNSKHAQNRSQKCPNVFWSCFRVIFSRKFFAQCSMEGRVFENFQKNQKSFKIPKMPKIVPKKVQTKIFKFKKNFKIPNMPKIVPKSVHRVLKLF